MKARISVALGIGLLLPLFAVGAVFAQDSSQTTTNTTTQTDDTSTTETKPLTDAQKKEMNARTEKRKAEAKLKLTAVQQKRIQARCKNAQGLVRSVGVKVKGVETSRTKIHANLVERLTELQTKLDAKNVDTTQLKAEIAELKVKIATFDTDLAAYKQLVADLAELDCTADPAAFKTSLDSARASLQKVRDDAVAVRTYVKDTIKPTLKSIQTQLESAENTSTTETN